MRGAALCLALWGCAPGVELLVEVSAEPEVVHLLPRVEVVATFASGEQARHVVELGGAAPRCLPFSLGVTPESGEEEPVVVELLAAVDRKVRTRFQPGLRHLLLHYDRACFQAPERCSAEEERLELPELERTAVEARLAATPCTEGQGGDLLQCVAEGGCLVDGACSVPCPTPPPPAPPAAPDPPLPPAPARLTPCAAGWAELPLEQGPSACQPWPEGQYPDCPDGQSRFPGEATCAPLGPECPTSDFGPAPPGALFVLAGAPPGGDGSPAAPFDTPGRALAAARPGATIALSRGEHRLLAAELVRAVHLLGACAADTRLRLGGGTLAAPDGTQLSALRVLDRRLSASGRLSLEALELGPGSGLVVPAGGSVSARRLRLRAVGGRGVELLAGGTFTATQAEIDQARGAAVSAAGGQLRLHQAALTRVAGDFAYGVTATGGAQVALTAVLVDDAGGYAIEVRDTGSRLLLEDGVVRGTRPTAAGDYGDALRAAQAATLEVRRSLVRGAFDAALYANSDAKAQLADVAILDVDSNQRSGERGEALLCASRCELVGERLFLRRAQRRAIEVSGDARAELRDVTVLDTRQREGSLGVGAWAIGGGELRLERAELLRHPLAGLHIELGGRMVVEDVLIQGTAGTGALGRGVEVEAGGELSANRLAVRWASDCGVRVETATSAAARVALRHLTIEDTVPIAPRFGIGLELGAFACSGASCVRDLHREAQVEVYSASLARNQLTGVSAIRARVRLEDVTVRDTRPTAGRGGFGLGATRGGVITGERVAILDNVDAGIHAGLIDTTETALAARIELSEALIRGTGCPAEVTGCFYRGVGAGLSLQGEIALSRFLVEDNALAGVYQFFNGALDLSVGAVRRNRTGVWIREEGFDLARILDRVVYDNEADLVVLPAPGG